MYLNRCQTRHPLGIIASIVLLNKMAVNAHGFRPTFPHHNPNQKLGWILSKSINCLHSVMGKEVNPSEQEAIDHLMTIATSHYPWSIGKTYQLSQSKVSAEEVIVLYRCIDRNCRIQYCIRRRNGKLASYTCGSHHHPAIVLEKGVNIETKRLLFIKLTNGGQAFSETFKEISRMDVERQKEYTGGLPCDSNFKTKIENASRAIAKNKQYNFRRTSKFGDIGTDMASLARFVSSRQMLLHDFASESNEVLQSMTKTQLNDLIIIDTDIGDTNTTDSNWTYVVTTTRYSLLLLDRACQMCRYLKQPLLFEVDYAHDVLGLKLVGKCGFSDMKRRFHKIVFDANRSESAIGSTRMLDAIEKLFRIRWSLCFNDDYTYRNRVLTDGSRALKNAAEATGLVHARCLSHMIRTNYNSKGVGHGSGTKGSLLRYMARKKCTDKHITSVWAFFHSFRQIPTREEWKAAHPLLVLHVQNELFNDLKPELADLIRKHMFAEYFDWEPKWGPAHFPGQVASINGLEKGWFYDRKDTKDLMHKFGGKSYQVMAYFEHISGYYTRNPPPEVFIKPLHLKDEWDKIYAFMAGLPGELRAAVYYDHVGKLLAAHPLVTGKTKSFIAYIPQAEYMNAIIEGYRHDLNVSLHSSTTNRIHTKRIKREGVEQLCWWEQPHMKAYLCKRLWSDMLGEYIPFFLLSVTLQ